MCVKHHPQAHTLWEGGAVATGKSGMNGWSKLNEGLRVIRSSYIVRFVCFKIPRHQYVSTSRAHDKTCLPRGSPPSPPLPSPHPRCYLHFHCSSPYIHVHNGQHGPFNVIPLLKTHPPPKKEKKGNTNTLCCRFGLLLTVGYYCTCVRTYV